MEWKEEYKTFLWILGVFTFAYFLPIESESFNTAITESFVLVKWYAREHVLLCLVPAFFIAGVISVFVSQGSVIKYFGANAKKWLAYLVASVSGTILAVCSCTILPLFSGIYKRGAGIGPAIAFLYSGPAINILAIILTAKILGFEIGIARIIGAVVFSLVIGIIMSFIYRKEEAEKAAAQMVMPPIEESRPLIQTSFHFFVLVGILVFANWGRPDEQNGIWFFLYNSKWVITGIFGILFSASLILILKLNKYYVLIGTAITLIASLLFSATPLIPFSTAVIVLTVILTFSKGEANEWLAETWGFTKQIMPLLGAGVLVAGFLLGAPGSENGIIPKEWISNLVGGNSFFANFFASVIGAFMYFATLTEVPILQGLMNSGMGNGPALALLLAGPALSLPNMLVIKSVIGFQKTAVYVLLVIIMATISGLIFGAIFRKEKGNYMNKKVLILCTGNSCRSQMAEGFLKSFDENLEVYSAGTKPSSHVHPKAIEVMKELNIDINSGKPENVELYINKSFDFVITVCGNAQETCPTFLGKVNKKLHIGFEDPADAKGSEEEVLNEFRKIRDEIKSDFYNFYKNEIKV